MSVIKTPKHQSPSLFFFALQSAEPGGEREFFIENLLVRIHYIIVMLKWTGLAPREFEGGDLPLAGRTVYPPIRCTPRAGFGRLLRPPYLLT